MVEVGWAHFLPQAADGLFTQFSRVSEDCHIVLHHCNLKHLALCSASNDAVSVCKILFFSSEYSKFFSNAITTHNNNLHYYYILTPSKRFKGFMNVN